MNKTILQGIQIMARSLDDVLAQVEAEDTKVDSLIALVNGLRDQIKNQVPGLTPDQQAEVDKIFDQASASSAKIDAALNANTPQAPVSGASGPDVTGATGQTPVNMNSPDAPPHADPSVNPPVDAASTAVPQDQGHVSPNTNELGVPIQADATKPADTAPGVPTPEAQPPSTTGDAAPTQTPSSDMPAQGQPPSDQTPTGAGAPTGVPGS
jgi:hypothetical protein